MENPLFAVIYVGMCNIFSIQTVNVKNVQNGRQTVDIFGNALGKLKLI